MQQRVTGSRALGRGAGREGRTGQALAELALTVVVFVLIMTAIFEFGRHFYTRSTVRHSVAEAARLASTGETLNDPATGREMTRPQSIVYVIERTAARLPVEVESVVLTPADGGGPGDVVRIVATYRFHFATGALLRSFAPTSIEFTEATTVENEPRF